MVKIPLCNLCGTTSKKVYEKSFDNYFIMNIYKCEKCGLMFQYPLPSKDEIENMYDINYYGGSKVAAYEDERKSFRFNSYVWKARIKKIKKNILSSNPKILDIGSSFGGFLYIANDFGFDPYGVEISDYARKYSAEILGKDKVFKNFFGVFKTEFFEVITMIEVIEHLEDPSSYLKECFRILKKNGILVIQTADMNGFQAKKEGINYHYFIPYHLYFFPAKALTDKLKEIGFTDIKVFRPVEFGLLPKLLKSRKDFKSVKDYFKWFKITFYHFKSFIHFKNFALTSSMVIYAKK